MYMVRMEEIESVTRKHLDTWTVTNGNIAIGIQSDILKHLSGEASWSMANNTTEPPTV